LAALGKGVGCFRVAAGDRHSTDQRSTAEQGGESAKNIEDKARDVTKEGEKDVQRRLESITSHEK